MIESPADGRSSGGGGRLEDDAAGVLKTLGRIPRRSRLRFLGASSGASGTPSEH